MEDQTKLATEIAKLEDMFGTEPLNPLLKAYMVDNGGFQSIKHPLVFSIMHSDMLNKTVNKQFAYKKEASAKALADKEWGRYIFLHERPYRVNAFCDIRDKLTDKEYWELLGHVWSDSENLWQFHGLLEHLIDCVRGERDNLMDDEERALLAKLPEKVVIYRGHQYKNKDGWSWTLSPSKAHWFGQRFFSKRWGIVKGEVDKKHIIAVLLGRNEFEVITNPKHVKTLRQDKVSGLEYFRFLAREQFVLKSSDHGESHWQQVELYGLELCKHVKHADKAIVKYFAIFHDCKRQNENDDPEHGERAAEFILTIKDKLGLSQEQLDKLIFAVTYHDKGAISLDPTVGVCWDSDRLELLRVGTIPDPQYFSTYAAKKYQWSI
jgi:ribosomal protein L21E